MRDPESAASAQVPEYDAEPLDEQRKLNAGLVCGDADTDLWPGLNAGRSETIPFFASFFDNLGPRYQPPPNSEGLQFEMTSFSRGQALHDSDPNQTDFDRFEFKSDGDHGFTDTGLPKSINDTIMIRTDAAAAVHDTPDSLLRAVQDAMPEQFESDQEVTSTWKELVRTSSGSSEGVLKGMSSTSSNRAICEATGLPKSSNVTIMIRTEAAPVHDTPDSLLRAIQDAMPEQFESGFESAQEVTSTWKKLVRTSSGSSGGVLKSMPSTSSKRAKCGRRIYVDDNGQDHGLQRQHSPVFSAGSSVSCHRTPIQCSRKLTLSDLPSKEKKLEDYQSKRLRLEEGFHQDFKQIARAALPSWRDDFDQIIHVLQVERCTVIAERRRRLQMSMSPARVSVSRPKEAMDRTLHKLQHWHFRLGLDNPACPTIASHIFWRAFQTFQRSRWPQRLQLEGHDQLRVRVLMATAFWVAAKIVDTKNKIPKASDMASTARITRKGLIHAELPMLDALQWRLVRF